MIVTSSIALVVVTDISFSIATIALLSATVYDVAFRTIPNWISTVILLVGSLLRVIDGTFMLGITVGIFVFIITGYFWYYRCLGGGDVKLLAAAAVLVPPHLTVNLLLDVALAGGVLAILYIVLSQVTRRPSGRLRPHGLLRRICRVERYRIYRRESLPYASAIATGAFLVLLKE